MEGSGTDEDRMVAKLYITEEDFEDSIRPELIPARDLLHCLTCLYLRKYVHGGKNFTMFSRSTKDSTVLNGKSRPANIHQASLEFAYVSESFVRSIVNSHEKDNIDRPTALAYLDYLRKKDINIDNTDG